ncbi:MAG: FMN-binding protein, partial [Opitutales bacterium]
MARSRVPRRLVDLGRLAVLAVIVFIIRDAHEEYLSQQAAQRQPLTLDQAKSFFPKAHSLSAEDSERRALIVLDAEENPLGRLAQTSPQSDASIGFSGSTNVLLAFGLDEKVVGLKILESGDTKEHLDAVLADNAFLATFKGRAVEELGKGIKVEGVSGATLTSMAIAEGIGARFGGPSDKGNRPSLRFPNPVSLAEAQSQWPETHSLAPSKTHPHLLDALDANGSLLGYLARTSPAAADVIGYQGPTDSLLAFDRNQTLTALSIRSSFDNQPYVGYVPQEYSFLALFEGRSLDQLADMNLTAEGVEGVSGATMTSMAVAKGIVKTAQSLRDADKVESDQGSSGKSLIWRLRDTGSLLVVAFAFLVAFTGLRRSKTARLVLQVALILYLGLVNGDILSQALLVGWAQSGAPWHLAPSLVLLALAALIVPITTRKQFYCHRLCPHGAAQEILQKTIGRKVRLSAKITRALETIPFLLLALVVAAAIGHFSFSLVNLEPFDAYLFRIAGWITLTIPVVGLVASAFV